MIWLAGRYPKPEGATDYMDSAHLIGMLVFLGHKIDNEILHSYVTSDGFIMRCPLNDGCSLEPSNYKNFTRDQFIPFISALAINKQYKTMHKVLKNVTWRMWNTEKDRSGGDKTFFPDILDPSHHGFLRILTFKKPTLFQKLWMIAKINFYAWFTPCEEPNNLIIMSYHYGMLEYLKKKNPQLYISIYKYWAGWRGEENLAAELCKTIGV